MKLISWIFVGLATISTVQAGVDDVWGKYDKIPPPPPNVPEFSNGRPICKCYIPPAPTAAPTAAPVL
jgi:hypothetical protein